MTAEKTEEKKTPRKTTAKKPATIAEALAAFQADLPSVTLDGENPHFKSKFATLANITHTVLPRLNEYGIAFSATPQVGEHGFVMEAHLLHESGEKLSASFPITETNPQKVGSAVTYFRRYALAALTGVVADADDDGNTASLPPKPTATSRKIEAAKQKATPAKAAGDDYREKIRVEIIENTEDSRTAQEVNDLNAKLKKENSKTGFKELYEALIRGEIA